MNFNAILGVGFSALLACTAVAQERTIIPDWPDEQPRQSRGYVLLPNQPNPDVPLPQDALLTPTLEDIAAAREDMQTALVTVEMSGADNTPYWLMSQTALTVFLNKLATLNQAPVPEDAFWPTIPKPEPRYNGMLIMLQTKDGRRFKPLRVFMGEMRTDPNILVAKDPGRAMEYWLFGTARVRRDQLLGANVLPVYTFEQCKVLGQRVIETTPRQCLLANNNLLLETNEPPTAVSVRLTSFSDCLREGNGLIYTFPRRCVAAGGRVFTEPPQIYDNATPLPKDAPVRKPKAKRLEPTPVSPTVPSPSLVVPLTVTPSVGAPPMATLGGGLLQNVSPTGRTWRDLRGTR